jgi:hypothetical protein
VDFAFPITAFTRSYGAKTERPLGWAVILYTHRMIAKRAKSCWSRLLLLALRACFLLGLLESADAQTNSSQQILVLESTNTIFYGDGHKDVQLLVRLTQNGKVQWEEPVWQKQLGLSYKRRVASISPEQVGAIKERLDRIGRNSFHTKIGPYNTYTDTSVELRLRVHTSAGSLAFTVINPWPRDPPYSSSKTKPLPTDVRAVICEASRLRAQLAGEPVPPMCESQKSSQ